MAEKINITFLGTGSSIPTKKRNHPSILLKYKEQNILFDCGEGTQRQFRKAGENPSKVNKIFITHWHGDHILGIPGLLQTITMSSQEKNIEIHGPKNTKKKVEEMMNLHMSAPLKKARKEGRPVNITAFDHLKGTVIDNEDYAIDCFTLDHDTPTLGYCFRVKEKTRIDKKKLKKLDLPNSPLIKELLKGKDVKIAKKKIDAKDLTYKEKERKICIVTDTRYNDSISKNLTSADLLIIESTYAQDEENLAREHGHLTSTLAARLAKESGTKKLALVHLSQKYSLVPSKIKSEAASVFEKEIEVPRDLDSITA